jgi:hypothetical protein
VGNEAGADGVVEDVLDRALEMLLGLDHPAREAVPEEVAPALVPPVEPLRVDAVEPLHPERQVLPRRLEDEVIVVVEQAERVHPPAEAPHDLVQQREELPAVVVVEEDRALLDAPRRDVEEAVGEQRAQRPGHVADASRGRRARNPSSLDRREPGTAS